MLLKKAGWLRIWQDSGSLSSQKLKGLEGRKNSSGGINIRTLIEKLTYKHMGRAKNKGG